MLKKTFLLFLFLFTTACGYEAIHSKKNKVDYDFAISKLTFIGDRSVNLKIKEKLNNYTLVKKNKNFALTISSQAKKEVFAKNVAGNPTSFKSIIIIDVKVLMENKLKSNLRIVESFNYNNDTNKFNLKKYESEIINNLTETASDRLIFKLSNIQ